MEVQTISPTIHRRPPDTGLSAAEIDAEVGRRLRVHRNMAGLSQQRLGELIGVSFQQIQKYERGTNRISAGRLVLIAGHLGVGPVDLLPESRASATRPPESPLRLNAFRALSAITDPAHLSAVIQLAKSLGCQKADHNDQTTGDAS